MLLMANNGYEWRKRRAFLNNFWLYLETSTINAWLCDNERRILMAILYQ